MKLYENFRINIDQVKKLCDIPEIREYDQGYLQPPFLFKESCGIDVSHNFNLGGLKIQDIQLLCRVDYDMGNHNLANLLSDLAKLNPELKTIKIGRFQNIYDICMGIASMFNLDDIKYFIGRWYESGYDRSIRDETKMHALLYIYKPSVNWYDEIQWILSDPTIKKIEKELIKKLGDGVTI